MAEHQAHAPSGEHAAAPARGRRLRWLILGGAGLALVAVGGAAWWWMSGTITTPAVDVSRTLAQAFEKLDAHQYREARQLAQLALTSSKPNSSSTQSANFIIGAAIVEEINAGSPNNGAALDEREALYKLALTHLHYAHEHGWPKGRAAEGRRMLADCLHETGLFAEAIPLLLQAQKQAPSPATQRLLASAYFRKTPADLAKAREEVDALLAAPNLNASLKQQAILLKCEIAMAQGDREASAAVLQTMPADSPLRREALLLQGQTLLEYAQGQPEPIQQAIELFRQVQGTDSSNELSKRAGYWTGVALRREGNLAAARQQFLRTRKLSEGSSLAALAALEEAEVLQEAQQYAESLIAYREAVRLAGPLKTFKSPMLTSAGLMQRLEQGYEQLLAKNRFDSALKLAKIIAPLISTERMLRLEVRAHDRWAQHLEQAAPAASAVVQAKQQAAARQQHRMAALQMTHLVNLNYTSREYPQLLWEAGRRFALGRDYQNAVLLFGKYLQTDAQEQRPMALVSLGEALLSLGQTKEALASLEECLRDFPKDPASYRARLLASAAHAEQGELDKAKTLLEANLHQQSLTPRSEAWRDSLFALGKVLHDQGRMLAAQEILGTPTLKKAESGTSPPQQSQDVLQNAQRKLTEAIQRYPEDAQSIQARYLLAQSHRRMADLPLAKLQNETIESRRASLNHQAQDELNAALTAYNDVLSNLNGLAEKRTLSELEQTILRNAYFHRPAVLYDLGSYEAAIQSYSTATNRYQHDPAAVEAYVQIAACYRRLNRPLEARGTLEQAKVVLQRIKPDADFNSTTRFGRDEWTTLIDWLSTSTMAGATPAVSINEG